MSKVVKGVGKAISGVVKGVVKGVKSFAKSKFGKIVLTAAAIYFGGAAISGAFSGGLSGAATALGNAASSLGTAASNLLSGSLSGATSALSQGFAGQLASGVGTAATQAATGLTSGLGLSAPSTGASLSGLSPTIGANALGGGAVPLGGLSPTLAAPTTGLIGNTANYSLLGAAQPVTGAGGIVDSIIQGAKGLGQFATDNPKTAQVGLILGGNALQGAATQRAAQRQEDNLLRRAYQNYSVGNLRV